MQKNKIAIIKSRIENHLSPTFLEVEDNSDEHLGHAGHQGGGRHFTVTIASPFLNHCTKIEGHRKIYQLFCDMIPDEIHALRIKIISPN